MARKANLKPIEAMELRRNREAGVPVKVAAAQAGVSVATAMRELAKLRKMLGPERFAADTPAYNARQRARAHLYANTANSQKPTSNTSR
jgi:hypothetical protein